MVQWLWLTWAAAGLAAGAGTNVSGNNETIIVMKPTSSPHFATDEQCHIMPQLFELDDYKECLSSPGGVYCLGSFQLRADDQHPLMDSIQKYSSEKYHFNRTLLHRGYCISARCGLADGSASPSAPERFARCVDRQTRQAHGLTARLLELKYCRTGSHQRPVDALDVGFACCVGLIVLANLLATAHDLLRGHDTKPSPHIQAWSLVSNWRRLTVDEAAGDPALKILIPLGGLRILCLTFITLGHSIYLEHSSYMLNTEFLESFYKTIGTVAFFNGTIIVQTFFLISSFLRAYTVLRMDSDQKQQLSVNTLSHWILHRIIRLLPLHMFVVGLSATWWSRVGDGPLWGPLVESQEARCRTAWWSHALFINNFIRVADTCSMHTWYIAADLQLYVVTCVLTMALVRWWRPSSLRILAALLLVSMLANFLVNYFWDLRSFVAYMVPETLRVLFAGQRSHDWMYKMPWPSLPTTVIGITLAFYLHHAQHTGYKIQHNVLICGVYNVSVPAALLAYFFSGYWKRELTSPVATALSVTLNRPVFAAMMSVTIFGAVCIIGNFWHRFLGWRCWQVLGRMSLSLYLVDWIIHITQVALRPHMIYMSWSVIIGHWLLNLLLTCSSGLLVHLMIEAPAQRCLNALLFTRS